MPVVLVVAAVAVVPVGPAALVALVVPTSAHLIYAMSFYRHTLSLHFHRFFFFISSHIFLSLRQHLYVRNLASTNFRSTSFAFLALGPPVV